MKCKYTSLVWLRVGSTSRSRSAKNQVYSTHYVRGVFYKALSVTTANQLRGACALYLSNKLLLEPVRRGGRPFSTIDMHLVLWRKCRHVQNSVPKAKTSFRVASALVLNSKQGRKKLQGILEFLSLPPLKMIIWPNMFSAPENNLVLNTSESKYTWSKQISHWKPDALRAL